MHSLIYIAYSRDEHVFRLFHAARLVVRDFGGQGAPIGVRSLALRSRL